MESLRQRKCGFFAVISASVLMDDRKEFQNLGTGTCQILRTCQMNREALDRQRSLPRLGPNPQSGRAKFHLGLNPESATSQGSRTRQSASLPTLGRWSPFWL